MVVYKISKVKIDPFSLYPQRPSEQYETSKDLRLSSKDTRRLLQSLGPRWHVRAGKNIPGQGGSNAEGTQLRRRARGPSTSVDARSGRELHLLRATRLWETDSSAASPTRGPTGRSFVSKTRWDTATNKSYFPTQRKRKAGRMERCSGLPNIPQEACQEVVQGGPTRSKLHKIQGTGRYRCRGEWRKIT